MFGQGLMFGGFSASPLLIDYFILAGGNNAGGTPGAKQGGSGGSSNYLEGYELESGEYVVTIGGGSTSTSFGEIQTVTSDATTVSPLGTFSRGNPIGPGTNTFVHGGGGAGGGSNGVNSSAPNTYNQYNPNNSPGRAGRGGNGYSQPVFGGTYAGGGGGSEYFNGLPPNPWHGSQGGTGGGGDGVWGISGAWSRQGDGDVNSGGGAGSMPNYGAIWTYNGGSGIAKIRYLTADGTATGGSVSTSGAYTIHTFTTSDSFIY